MSPRTFRAAVLAEQRAPLVLDELEVPELRFGQVLVEIRCSGICGAQLNEIDGAKGADPFLPHLLGHEATATVIETGEGVTSVEPGDTVVCHWRKGAGLQAPTPSFRSATFDRVNAGWVTTFGECSVVSENRVTRVPSELDPEVAALFGCAVTTAMGVLNNDARLGIGESLAVFGTGGVGLSIVQLAAMISAYPIIAIDRYEARLELASRLGATHLVHADGADVEAEIRRIVGPAGADVAVDTTGNAAVIETAYAATSDSGRLVLVGVPAKGERHPSFYTLPLHFEKVLTGSEGGGSRPDVDIPKLVRLLGAGRLSLDGLVTQRYRLEQINDAIDDLRRGRIAGRCIVWMDGGPT
jgi:S-(hydroxymethyl)glutathione dehydrogenase/alcohol dehydrogenase